MRLVRVSDGATVFTWAPGSFNMILTTVSTDTTDPDFSERVQRLVVPLGATNSTDPLHQIAPPQNLAQGSYELVWNDFARVDGIQNSGPFCSEETAFGLRTRFIYDGTANATPRFDSVVAAGVPRGFEYEENLNAVDPDGDSLAYTFAPLAVPSVSPFPDYGPVSRVPGITLDQFGTVRIPDSFTPLLFDNVVQPSSRADYFDKFVVTDSRGAFAERDVMYDAVDRFPPTLDPIGNRTVFAGSPLTFAVTGNAPLSGLSSISLRATSLPAGATLSGGLPTISPTVTGAFTWTPVAADVEVHGVNFDVVADFGSPPQLVDSEFVEITVVSANRPPVLQEISNQRVGADPLNVQVFVSTPLTFDALAVDPNAGDTLTYSLPILIDPAGTVAPLGDLGASIVDTTDATGAPIGRVTIAPDFADIGVWQLRIRVDDGAGGSDEVNVFLSVGTFTNQSPVFTTLPPAEVFIAEEGTTEFTVTASDPDNGAGGQLVTLTTTGAPPGATFPEGNVAATPSPAPSRGRLRPGRPVTTLSSSTPRTTACRRSPSAPRRPSTCSIRCVPPRSSSTVSPPIAARPRAAPG